MIRVTCALILQYERVLVTQRSQSMSQPLLWEFPGGKIEEGESETECLEREIREELNLSITPLHRLTPVRHQGIELIPYLCQYNSGVIVPAEHRSYQWASASELPHYTWCPADIPVMQEYLALDVSTLPITKIP